MNEIKIGTDEIQYKKGLYPRSKPIPGRIVQYASVIEKLDPVEVTKDRKILVDGYHRWKAHQEAGCETISVFWSEAKTDEEIEERAAKVNSTGGDQLNSADKKRLARKWYGEKDSTRIRNLLSIPGRTFRDWTQKQRQAKKKEQKRMIFEMWLACYTQQEIASAVEIAVGNVNEKIAEFEKNFKNGNFAEFEKISSFVAEHFAGNGVPVDFEPEVYSCWNFSKNDERYGVEYPGRIPGQIIENLLYYFTEPFDIVLDLFGGGGTTIDVCQRWLRRSYVTDLIPTPLRDDIRQHDILSKNGNGKYKIALPSGINPQLVILDPPYAQQKQEEYSDDETNLANLKVDDFHDVLKKLIVALKRKMDNGFITLILGHSQESFHKEFHGLEVLIRTNKITNLELCDIIEVPYTSEQYGGQQVKTAKESKYMLNLSRWLIIFKVIK